MLRLTALLSCLLLAFTALAQVKPDSATAIQHRIAGVEITTSSSTAGHGSARETQYVVKLEYNQHGQLLKDEMYGPKGNRTHYIHKSWLTAGQPEYSETNGNRIDYHYRYDEFKQVVEKWEFRNDTGKQVGDTTIERYSWNRKGQMTKIERYLLGRKMLHKEYTYDKSGTLTEMRIFREGEMAPHIRKAFTLDPKNRVIKAESFSNKSQGTETVTEVITYEYSDTGDLVQEVRIYPGNRTDNRKIAYEYDNQANLIDRQEYAQSPNDKFDQLLRQETWEYGINRQILGYKSPEKMEEHQVNELGQIVRSSYFQRDADAKREANPDPKSYKPTLRDEFVYNKAGKLIEIKRFDLIMGSADVPIKTTRFLENGLIMAIREIAPGNGPREEVITEFKYTFRK